MYSYTRKVHYYETDKMGIVHHAIIVATLGIIWFIYFFDLWWIM